MTKYAALPIAFANDLASYLYKRPMKEVENFVVGLRQAQLVDIEEAPPKKEEESPKVDGEVVPLKEVEKKEESDSEKQEGANDE